MGIRKTKIILICCGVYFFTTLSPELHAQTGVTFGSGKDNKSVLDSLISSFNKSVLKTSSVKSSSDKIHDLKSFENGGLKVDNLRSKYGARQLSPQKLKKYTDFYRSADLVKRSFSSSSLSLNSLSSEQNVIMNSKYVRRYYDSVKRLMPVMPGDQQIPGLPGSSVKPMSQEQLVSDVNTKFSEMAHNIKDSVKNSGISSAKQAVVSKTAAVHSKIDLVHSKMDPAQVGDLKPIAGNIVKSKYLSRLDSLRQVNLAKQGLKLKEETSDVKSKVVLIKKQETVWNKSYFEGIISLPHGNSTVFQASPAFAYHVTKRYSLGAGPTILINRDQKKVTTLVGARVFAKAEFVNRLLYTQVEDQINPHTVGREGMYFTQHNVYGGGGAVIPYLSPLTLNVALFYRWYASGNAENTASPWMFRIGISTNKKRK